MKQETDLPTRRGRKASGRQLKTVTFKLSRDIRERLEVASDATHTKASLVETALDNHLPKLPSCL